MEEKLYLVMDESDAPYEDNEYEQTMEDNLALLDLAEKHGLEIDPTSELGKLKAIRHLLPRI